MRKSKMTKCDFCEYYIVKEKECFFTLATIIRTSYCKTAVERMIKSLNGGESE